VVLSVAKLARGREGYYLATVASGREDLRTLVEPDGRWLGKAAAQLGLVGAVDSHALHKLLGGVDPVSGEILSTHHERVSIVAYDCTYSTPKSVSILHALGPEEVGTQVRAGHEQAAKSALEYLERRGARVRRRLEPGQAASSVPAGGFVAAAFLHRTSRAPDPHLHSHVLVANLGPGPDGRWSALDARGLFLELGTARDLYETELRAELTCRLGVSWRELQGAWADLSGIEPTVRRAFSRRSVDIETALEQAGRSGPLAARIASVKTRPEKDLETPYEELVQTWRERSYRLGVSDSRIASVAGRSQVARDDPFARAEMDADGRRRWADAALGEHGALARDGTCRRSDLIRSRCRSLPLGSAVSDIEREVESLLADGRLVPVPAPERSFAPVLKTTSGRSIPGGVPEPLFTTPAVLEIHERLGEMVREHREAVELLAYPPGGRLAALDALGIVASRSDSPVIAVAPGRTAAASFEAVTGIETTTVAEVPLDRSATTTVVVAEAHRLGPWELSTVIESSLGVGNRLILFAPSATLQARFSTTAVLAPGVAKFASDGRFDAPPVRESSALDLESYCFAGREVLVVGDGSSARDALLDAWKRDRARGQRPLVVASDDAVVRSLRDAVGAAGGSPDDVVESRRLTDQLANRRTATGLGGTVVVLGRLPTGVGDLAPSECIQVAIVASRCSPAERLGRAAEIARPQYLVSEIGATRFAGSERSAWRCAATTIESFRRRWSIDDHEHAVGGRSTSRSLGLLAASDQAETRLKIRQALRGIEPMVKAIGRSALEIPSRTR